MLSKPILELKDLTVGYHQGHPLLGPLNLKLEAGEVVSLIGANGSGKTSLLKTLSGLLKPLGGEVLLDGTPLCQIDGVALARLLSVVLTEKDFPWGLQTLEVLELARIPYTGFFGRLGAEDRRVIQSVVEAFDLGGLIDKPLNELSDGQRQRVLIARSLIQETQIILLDEPTTFLDIQHQVEIMLLLKKVASSFNKTIILTSHHWELILELSTKLWIVELDKLSLFESCAEELILRDELNDYFKPKAGSFDKDSGRFVLEPCHVHGINVIAPAQEQRWILHALGKWGYYQEAQSDTILEFHRGHYLIKKSSGQTVKSESLLDVIKNLKSPSVEL
jgi:iron complex transport system ATP-binding protein